MSQGASEFSVIAFLWAVCSGVGKAELMFQKHHSLTVSERKKKARPGHSAHIAYSPVEAPVFKIHSMCYPCGEARRIIIGNFFKP